MDRSTSRYSVAIVALCAGFISDYGCASSYAQDSIATELRGVYSVSPSISPEVRANRPASSLTPAVPSIDSAIDAFDKSVPPGLGSASAQGSSIEATLRPSSPQSFDVNRERLFNELAEEYAAFDRLGNLVKRVAQLVAPSVMHIEAHKTETAGAGVVIDVAGERWVLTNRHVVLGSKPQEILLRTSDGQKLSPSRVIADASTDVAVLKLETNELPPARIGNSSSVETGDFVIAIGSPFGLSHSVTFGIVSAKGRRDLSLGEQKIDLQDFFQTDAAINPGNSGGPLLNLRGEVVAVNTAIASSSGGSEGIGFAIPINMGIQVADQLIRHGRLRRGYLGVTLEPEFTPADMVAAGYAASGGALVKSVRAGSPAALARLQRGDIIIEFDGRQVDDDDHLVAQVGLTPIGANVPMIIYRDGKRYRTDVVLVDLE